MNSILCNTNRMHVGIISLLITLTYIGQLPNIAEGIYWYSGAVAYLLPLFPTMLFFSLIYNYLNKKWFINKSFHVIGLIVLQFIIIGFNEVHMLYVLLFHLVLAIIESRKKKPEVGLVLLITAILFSSIIILSPGNFGRSSMFDNNHDILASGLSSLFQTIRFSTSLISSAPVLLLSILYIPFHFNLKLSLT